MVNNKNNKVGVNVIFFMNKNLIVVNKNDRFKIIVSNSDAKLNQTSPVILYKMLLKLILI